jgi:two-component system sensor histidine kinase HydH
VNTLIYTAVAVLALALPLRAWLQDRSSRVRAGFALLGVNLAWVYGAFSGYLITGLPGWDLAYGVGGAFLPVTLYRFLITMLRRPSPTDGRRQARLAWTGFAVACCFVAAQCLIFDEAPHGSPAAIALGLWVFGGLGFDLFVMAEHQRQAVQRVVRARLGYLLALTGLSMFFSALEVLTRTIQGMPEPASLDLLSAPVQLQGALPPMGVLFTGVLIYFLHQVLVLYRLLDPHEILSRTLTFAICAALLVGVQALLVIRSDPADLNPLHSAWLMLVATVLFLAIYDPLRRAVERRLRARLNRRGLLLARSLREVDEALPKAIGLATAFEAVLPPIVGSGRCPYAAVYLWDQERGKFTRAASQGSCATEPLETVPPLSISDEQTPRWLVRTELVREARRRIATAERAGQRARLMKAMGLDLLLPLRSGELVLGWLGLADEPESEGYSPEELGRLRESADKLTVVLENVHGFHQLEEQHRLAALGTMAAGLAHEIRNPLAAIKGAAQYLAVAGPGSPTPDEDDPQDFVAIIVEEVDRLEAVVSRFLDYARPLDLGRHPTDLNLVATRAVESIQRQGGCAGIEMELALTEALPMVPADATLLLQVLENLLRNAVQALERLKDPAAPRRVRLHTRLGHAFGHGQGPSTVDVVVEDTGPGIPEQERSKLFIPFYTRRAGGTGLGLALSRRIVRAHGGELDVGARPGGGARFTVLLPLEHSPDDR